MEENKICPILSIAKHISDFMGTNNNLILCQRSDCAWWDKTSECCIIHALSCLNKNE
jgi:hypothetical protein